MDEDGLNPLAGTGLRNLVSDITRQALQEYDDGPLTPQPEALDEIGENRGDGDDELDDENNLVVLDPNHELMKRFQTALKKLLTKREEKLTLEAREAKYELEKTKKLREDLGVELYGLQQELAKHQTLLEKEHDSFNDVHQYRQVIESNLDKTRQNYREQQSQVDEEQKKVRDLQQERDNLKLRIFYMANAKDDLRGDIAVIRRATEKAETEKSKYELEKQRQDLLVNRLQEKEQSLREDISLYQSQLQNQMKESKHAREALVEARMETESIEIEKKQLMNNWTSCLIGIRRRDEAYTQMNEAIRSQRLKLDLEVVEIESLKKSILLEQETNEKKTVLTNNRTAEKNNLIKQLKTVEEKIDMIKSEYSVYSKSLKDTEEKLMTVNAEKAQKNSEMGQLQRDVEAINQEKVKLEDEIFKILQRKLTAEKAAQYSEKLRKEQTEKIRELERNLAKIENDVAKIKLEIVRTETSNENLQHDRNMLKSEIEDKNRIISRSEAEIKQRILLIEHKQGIMDLYNKKIEKLIEKAGGVELGPLELEEKNLNKEIEDILNKIMELEQKWLREQNELVKLVKERETKRKELIEKKQELTVLNTKKMRIEKHIESEEVSIKTVNKNLEGLRLQLEKLNKYIFRESDTKTSLVKNTVLVENDFVLELKEAERESIRLDERMDELKRAKEDLLNDLIETDEQIMMWEKRTQIAKEMKAAVDSETGQGEIREMKFSIHRMKVRYGELMKQQEKLVRDMEACVSRRDTIVTRGDIQFQNPKIVTQGKIQRDIIEVQRKIKETTKETKKLESDINTLQLKQQDLAGILEQKQNNLQQLNYLSDAKEADIENYNRRKQENQDELLMKQEKVKFYNSLKDGKYKMSSRTEIGIEQEILKQVDKLRSLNAIINKLVEEYPNLQTIIRRIELSIQTRLYQEEEGSDKI